MKPAYSYGTPKWAVFALLALSGALSLVGLLVFLSFDSLTTDEPRFLKWFLLLLAIGFSLPLIRAKNWKQWTYFIADRQGLRFPSECPSNGQTRWLKVEWADIGEISEQKFINGSAGLAIELKLSRSDIDEYFEDLKRTHELLGTPQSRGDYFVVGYSNTFSNPKKALAAINAIKERHA